MTLTKKDKDFLQAAFEAGSRPVRSSGGNLVLKHDNKRKQLTRGRRKLEAGKHFYTLMGEELPEFGQGVVIRGNAELTTRNGKLQKLRHWDAGENKYKYTAAGKKYYQKNRSQWIVHVPLLIN